MEIGTCIRMHRIGDYCYDIATQVIGRGTYGNVYRGNSIKDINEPVAIKVIDRGKGAARTTPREVLDREIDILKIAEPIVSLVLEFCNGGDFRDYLRDRDTLQEAVIHRFFGQIGSGLLFLHEKNIVHRDLKPENILLCFDGDKYPAPKMIVLKIADFGLCRILSAEDIDAAMSFCGTPLYTAPEIVERRQYDTKVDMWSIGVMIYECLVGTSNACLLTELKFSQNVSLEIRNLLSHLIARDPRHRLSCDQFLSHSFLRQQMHERMKELKNTATKDESTFPSKGDSTSSSKIGRWFRNTFNLGRINDSKGKTDHVEYADSDASVSQEHESQLQKVKVTIDRHYDFLVERMFPDFDLYEKLHEDLCVTRTQIYVIKATETVRRKNELLLKYLIKNQREEKLFEALNQSDQKHLVNYLENDGEYIETFIGDWPITNKEILIIQSNHRAFVDLIEIDDLIDPLYQTGAIDKERHNFVLSQSEPHKKNEALLKILKRCSLNSYWQIIRCLRYTEQCHIADILETGGVMVRVDSNLNNINHLEIKEISAHIVTLINNITNEIKRVKDERLLDEMLQLKLIGAKQHEDVSLYFLCNQSEEVDRLQKMAEDGRLKEFVESFFNQLKRIQEEIEVTLKWTPNIFTRSRALIQAIRAEVETSQWTPTTINELPLEVIDVIIQKSIAIFIQIKSQTDDVKYQEGFKQLAEVNVCWFKRMTNRRFKNDLWSYLSVPPYIFDESLETIDQQGQAVGVTKLRNEIYFLNYDGEIKVFNDRDPFALLRKFQLKEIERAKDIVSCEKENAIYILDLNPYSFACVWKIEQSWKTNQSEIKWLEIPADFRPFTLSMSKSGQLLMVSQKPSLNLRVYGSDAQLHLSISPHQYIKCPIHAVETSTGNFVILHFLGKESTITILSRDGKTIVHDYQPENKEQRLIGFAAGYLIIDSNNRTFVADTYNYRVILLDSNLRWNEILFSGNEGKDKDSRNKIRFHPHRLYYDEGKKHLIVCGFNGVEIVFFNKF